MKKTIQIIIIVTVISLGGIQIVHAETTIQPTEEELQMIQKKREWKEQMKAKIREELGVTEEQEKKLEEHRAANREQGKALRQTLRALKTEIRTELEKPELDRAKINEIHAKIKEVRGQMEDRRLEDILEVREILTPEQFAKFHKMREKRKGHWRKDDDEGFGGFRKGGEGFMRNRF